MQCSAVQVQSVDSYMLDVCIEKNTPAATSKNYNQRMYVYMAEEPSLSLSLLVTFIRRSNTQILNKTAQYSLLSTRTYQLIC